MKTTKQNLLLVAKKTNTFKEDVMCNRPKGINEEWQPTSNLVNDLDATTILLKSSWQYAVAYWAHKKENYYYQIDCDVENLCDPEDWEFYIKLD